MDLNEELKALVERRRLEEWAEKNEPTSKNGGKVKKIIIGISSLCIAIVIGLLVASHYTSVGQQLKAKVEEAKALRIKLDDKRMGVIATREAFIREIRSLKREILIVKKERGIATYGQAVGDRRIKNNLYLIQTKLAYVEKLDQVEVQIGAGIEELIFIERQIDDKIKIVGLLGEEEVNNLVRQIDSVIKARSPEAERFAINMEGIRLRSFEQIWSDIVNGRL